MAEIGRIGIGPGEAGTEIEIVVVDLDPRTNAVDATLGSIIILSTTGQQFRKLDNGLSTLVTDPVNLKNNEAAGSPAVGNDNTQDYAVFSLWRNTSTNAIFICANPATGAAVWTEITSVGGGGAVDSVFGRTGVVTAANGDYNAAQVTFTPDGDIAAVTVQAAIVELRDDTDTKLSGYSLTSHTHAHSSLTGIGSDDHHSRVHNLDHGLGGNDEISIVGMATTPGGGQTDTTRALHPDGFGGVDWVNTLHSDLASVGTDDHHARDHAATHISGADVIDGDQLDITFTPSNYTPTTAPAEAASLDHLTAHLAGIDAALTGGGGNVSASGTPLDNQLAIWTNGTTIEGDPLLTWDGALNRLGVTGQVLQQYTAVESDDEALRIVANAAGFGGFKAVNLDYETGAVAAGQNEEVILVNIDESLATGGRVVALEVVSTAAGVVEVDAIEAGVNVHPLLQQSGVFEDTDSILVIAVDQTVALSGGGAGNISLFVANSDTLTIGDAAKFAEIEVLLGTPASNPGIAPTFEYSTGVGTWATFSPADGTDQFRQTGVMSWSVNDIPGWLVGTGGEFLIRITRTRVTLGTTPICDLIQVAATIEYKWDKDGDVSIRQLELADQDVTPVAARRLRVIDGLIRAADISNVEGRFISAASVELHAPDAHTIASHSDTLATGAELDTLTDGSNADALHTHTGGGAVDSVFTRTGAVVAVAGDYDATEITFAANGDIAAVTVQAAIVEVRDDTDTKLLGKANTSHTHTLVDVTDSGALAALNTVGTAEIDDDAVTYAKIQNVTVTARILGRITAGAGIVEELTGTQATTLLDLFTSGLQGVVPASGGVSTDFLSADGTWSAPAGGGSHAATHILGGGDVIDGDQIDITFTPTNYTPTIAPAEATDLDHLTAHLAGIDAALTGGGAVDSVFGRTGVVIAVAGDYDATEVTFTPDGDIAAVTVQAAIVEVRDDTDTKLAGKSDTSHTHAHSAITGVGTDDHHNEAHTVASHSDTLATGAELDTLTDGSNADALHSHLAAGGEMFSAHHDTTVTDISDAGVGGTWHDVPLDVESKKTAGMTHAANAAFLTVDVTGTYLVAGYVTSATTLGSSRAQTEMRLMRDPVGAAPVAEVPGTKGGGYNRNTSQNANSCSFCILLDLTAGDILHLEARTTTAGTDTVELLAKGSGLTLIQPGAQGDAGGAGPTGPAAESVLIPADAFENPNNDDWAVNSLAPPAPSANNLGLTVRKFPDVFAVPADESGVGWKLRIPVGATTMKLRLWSAADTAGGAVRTVGLKLYYRKITDGVAPSGTWAGANDGDEVLTDIDIPDDELPIDDDQTLTLASLTPVIPADELYQFELTRIAPAGGTELTGDWDLFALLVEFA